MSERDNFSRETKFDRVYKIEIPPPTYIPLSEVFKEQGIPVESYDISVYLGRHATQQDAQDFLDFAQDADIIVPERIMWYKGDVSHYLYDVFSESTVKDYDLLIQEYGLNKIPPSHDKQFYLGLFKGIKGTKKKILFIDDEDFDTVDLEDIKSIFKFDYSDDIVNMNIHSATEVYWNKFKRFVEFQIGRENRSIERIQSGMVELLKRHPELIMSKLKIAFFWGALHERFAEILKNAGESVYIKKGYPLTMGMHIAAKKLSAGMVLDEVEMQHLTLESIFWEILQRYSHDTHTFKILSSLMPKLLLRGTNEEVYNILSKAYNDREYADVLIETLLKE